MVVQYSIVGALIGSVIALGGVLLDNLILLVISVFIAGFFSAFDNFPMRVISLIVYYISWFVLMYLHTVIFNSEAILGLFALVFYSIFIIPLYFLIGLIISFILKKFKK